MAVGAVSEEVDTNAVAPGLGVVGLVKPPSPTVTVELEPIVTPEGREIITVVPLTLMAEATADPVALTE
jgi:hypothetical protein